MRADLDKMYDVPYAFVTDQMVRWLLLALGALVLKDLKFSFPDERNCKTFIYTRLS